jgi:putative sterol carrier protein
MEEPERMNLLGLFMRSALADRAGALEGAGLRGDVALVAGSMSCTLSFGPERVVVRKGVHGKPRVRLRGSLESLVQLARGRTAAMLLRGKVRVSGNPLAALPLARVFKAEAR